MRTVEHVKLKTDSNYIHIKYAVLEVTVGSTLAASQAWIKCISFGCDTKDNLELLKWSRDGYEVDLVDGVRVKQDPYRGEDRSGMVGQPGEYQVVTLADIEPYSRGGKIDFTPNFELG